MFSPHTFEMAYVLGLRRRFLRLGKRIIYVSHCISYAVDSGRASEDDLFYVEVPAPSIMLYIAMEEDDIPGFSARQI